MEVGLNFETDFVLHSSHFHEYVPYEWKF